MIALITIDLDAKNQNNRNFEIQNLDFGYREQLKLFCRLIYPCTLFARIDRQTNNLDMAQNVLYKGEIGWHPHIYEFDGKWKQTKSEDFIVDELEEIYNKEDLKNFSYIRIGNCHGGNKIFKWIQDKFILDSSSMPGCFRRDDHRNYDWLDALSYPYFPSQENYKVQQDLNWSFIELPLTTLCTKTCYDEKPKLRVLNPSYRPEIFREAVKGHNFSSPIVIAFHGDELEEGYVDDLYCYGMENIVNNLIFLENQGVEFETITNWRRSWFAERNKTV